MNRRASCNYFPRKIWTIRGDSVRKAEKRLRFWAFMSKYGCALHSTPVVHLGWHGAAAVCSSRDCRIEPERSNRYRTSRRYQSYPELTFGVPLRLLFWSRDVFLRRYMLLHRGLTRAGA
jgi:hypothetical protein